MAKDVNNLPHHPDDDDDDDEGEDDAASTSAATISELCTSDAVDVEEPLVASVKDKKLQRLQQQVESKPKENTTEKPGDSRDLKALGEQLKALFQEAKAKSEQQKKQSDHHLPPQVTCHLGYILNGFDNSNWWIRPYLFWVG